MLREGNGNGIYELTDEDKELISHHGLFYDELCSFGNKILDIGFYDGMEHFKLTIYSFIYKILELLDALKVMTQSSLINPAFIIVRSLLDAVAQLYYVIFDEKTCEQKALVFQLYIMYEKANNKENFLKELENDELFGKYIIEFKNEKKYHNWYAYVDSKLNTIKALFKAIGWERLYNNLYAPLCSNTHASDCMSDIDFINEKYMFKPFRTFENHVLLLHSVLTVMLPVYTRLIDCYGDAQLKEEWLIYQQKMKQYLSSNNRIAFLTKLFNPNTRWYFANNVNND